jgi:hypothetical protein
LGRLPNCLATEKQTSGTNDDDFGLSGRHKILLAYAPEISQQGCLTRFVAEDTILVLE